MTDSVVVEGYARLREGKKWKNRWLVLRKPSPVADCLVLLVFKDKSDKAQGNKERVSVTLEEICGLEAAQWYEGVAFTLTILCLNQAALLGFDSKETLLAWDARLRYSLGEVHRFSVGVLPGTKLESGPATLHLCNNLLALARDVPPIIIGHWNLPDLRRYGPVPNGFVFEGGTRCGYWAGVFLLASVESEQISFLFDCIVRGISPTRGPFGLRPLLPVFGVGGYGGYSSDVADPTTQQEAGEQHAEDPSTSQTSSEERLNHEAQELEKRLSLLSHRSSTASSSYCPSAGGDDRSISGSSDTSDTSQSDCSIGSQLAIWSDTASSQPENVGHVGGARAPLQSIEKISVGQGAGSRPAAKPPRQLQEIGRQSSSDSGIATGSHSSYSGSFSSYTGSLDMAPSEDFGSVFSLPPHLAQELNPCTCLAASGHEYQVPTSLRYLYDIPRSVLQEGGVDTKDREPSMSTGGSTAPLSHTTDSEKLHKSCGGPSETADKESVSEHSQGLSEESKKTKAMPSCGHPDSCNICSSKTIVTICSVCGGFKGTPHIPASGSVIPAIPEHDNLNSADQSKYHNTVRKSLEKTSTVKTREHSKNKRDDVAGFLALLGLPPADEQLEVMTNRLNLYESMSRRHGNGLKTAPTGNYAPSQELWHDKKAVIYENCLKCQGERCQPPPRVTPAQIFHNRKVLTVQTSPTRLGLRRHREYEATTIEEVCSNGFQTAAGQHRNEINGWTEDKRLNSKEERRRADPAYEIMESRAPERNSEEDEKSKYELMGSCGQQRLLQETEGRAFIFPPETPLPERPHSEGATYVNIPISPTSKKQLNYMELELQEQGPGSWGIVAHPPPQRKSSTRYAQIDITATETAHKVGTQHALGRQEGLHTLELRRKGTPH